MGFGKAACQMTKATEDSLKDLITTGTVITKYGHCPSSYRSENVKVIEAGHPVPDENGLKGTEEIIGLLKNSNENTLVVCLISGGGSALLVAPYEGITLEEKQKIPGNFFTPLRQKGSVTHREDFFISLEIVIKEKQYQF